MRPLHSTPILLEDHSGRARYEYRGYKFELRKPHKRWLCQGIGIGLFEAPSVSFSRERLLNRMCREIDRRAKTSAMNSAMPRIIHTRPATGLPQASPGSQLKINAPC